MSVSPLTHPARLALSTAVTAAAIAFGGCNSLLDNRPADVGEDLFHTDPADAGGQRSEAGRDGGASARDQPDSDSGIIPLQPQCQVGSKPCGEACVSTSNPTFGCGGPTCERCAPAHAVAACPSAVCAVGKCEEGWADCNGLVADGCETDLSSPTTCGACGITCPVAGPHADVACTDLACTSTCLAGFGDCNANPADGCETNILSEKQNCGACGAFCIIGKCEQGVCKIHF